MEEINGYTHTDIKACKYYAKKYGAERKTWKGIELKVTKIRKRDGRIVDFDPEKIVNAIFKAAQAVGGRDRVLAEKLAMEVVKIVNERFKGKIPTVEDVQDIVEKVLVENGHYKTAKAYILYREEHRKLREIKSLLLDVGNIVDTYISQSDWRVRENANAGYSLSGLLWHATGTVMAYYALNYIYPREVAKAHVDGDFHLHDLCMSLAGYSFYRNETVVVRQKSTNKVFALSLEQLFDMVNSKVIRENGFEIKYTDDFEILDENGWVKLIRVLRHKAKSPYLLSFNTEHGFNVVVTADHPFITLEDLKEEVFCPQCKSKDVVKNRSYHKCKEGLKDYYKCKSCGYTFSKVVKNIDLNRRVVKFAAEINERNYAITPKFKINIKKMENGLTSKDGWFIGFYIADGYLHDYRICFEIKQGKEFEKLLNYLKEREIKFSCRERQGKKVVEINVNNLPENVKKVILSIRSGAENKNLPDDFLMFKDEVIGGIVSGVIDGDGCVRNDDTWVSRVLIRACAKTLLEQIQIWCLLNNINASLSSIESYGKREHEGRIIKSKKQLYCLTVYIPESKKHLFKECLKIDEKFKFSKEHGKTKLGVIRKIDVIVNDSSFVYDITTETHTFVCNGVLVHNCAGWSLRKLLLEGFNGVPGKVESKPSKHLRSALGQMVNFIGTLQNEWAGAQAFSSFDTYLAPFVYYDRLNYKEVKQAIQEFVFGVNASSRWGGQTPFSNITLDWMVPEDLKDQNVIVGGELKSETYEDFQDEMDMINRAFIEVMTEGDAKGRVFTFPIPTYNITKDFDWNSENTSMLFDMTAKYGLPYFQNFINSDLKPSDVRAMCCRLQLNLAELRKKTGGLFGFGESTGSIGVVTINMPRIGYLSKDDDEFFERLERLMYLAKVALEVKRKLVERNMKSGLLPYTKRYLGTLDFHFSTIGLVGMNEACLNFLGVDIGDKEGHRFALKVLDFMLDIIKEYQVETGHLYNLEATPAEGTSYRLARIDKKKYPKIITAGEKVPYYTNSTQLPVDYTDDLFWALKHQEPLQCKYTGGTVFHIFLGEALDDGEEVKLLIRRIAERFRIPYYTITPTFSICPNHGYLKGKYSKCPSCGARTEIYSRVVGYLRPVQDWNAGKQEEFRQRIGFKIA